MEAVTEGNKIMKTRAWMILFICLWCVLWLISAAMAQEPVVGTAGDAAVNLVVSPVGELIVVSGVVNGEPVNVVAQTKGRLIARIRWTDTTVSQPVEVKGLKGEATAPEKRR